MTLDSNRAQKSHYGFSASALASLKYSRNAFGPPVLDTPTLREPDALACGNRPGGQDPSPSG